MTITCEKGIRLSGQGWARGCCLLDPNGRTYIGTACMADPETDDYVMDAVEVYPDTICRRLGETDVWEHDIVSLDGYTGEVLFGLYDGWHYGFIIRWDGNCKYRQDAGYWFFGAKRQPEVIGSMLDGRLRK